MPYQKTREGRLVNEITLGDGYPLSNDKQPLKVGGEASIINVSSPTPDGSVDGEVEVKGKLRAKDTIIQGNLKAFSDSDTTPAFMFETKQGVNCMLRVQSAANTRTALMLKNSQGYFELRRDSSTTSLKFTDGTNTPLILDGNNVEFTNLTDGSITIDSFVDEDNMSSNSATKIPTQQSVKAYVDNEVAGLVDSAPAALDTLNELAAALNDDASFSTTVTNSLALKAPLAAPAFTGNATFDSTTLTIDATNNRVGIGTASPQSLLHLQGSGNTGGLYFKNSYDIVRQYFQNDSDNSPFVITYDGTGGAEITLQSDGDLILNGSNGDNVGIGTDSPSEKLHVSGNAKISGDLTVDTSTLKVDSSNDAVSIGSATGSPNMKLEVVAGANDGILVNRNSTSTGSPVEIGFRHTTSAGDASTGMRSYRTNEDTSYDQELRFFTTAGSGGQAEHLTIKHNGNVGIGTTSPTTTLDVEGTVSYKHISLTDSSDDLDVSGCTVVECTPSGTDRLGGLTGGVQGQILYILKVDSGFGRIIIEHAEGTGNQDIRLIGSADVMLSERSGMTFYCTGSEWIQVG